MSRVIILCDYSSLRRLMRTSGGLDKRNCVFCEDYTKVVQRKNSRFLDTEEEETKQKLGM
jgi:hypothetical protein